MISSVVCGKASKTQVDIYTFHVSSGPLSQPLLRGKAIHHVLILTGELQRCRACLEAKGVRVGVPRRTTSRAGRSTETVQIDLSGLYEASIGWSDQLIIVVDSAWRRMWPYGMKSMAETTMFAHTLLTDMTPRNRAVSTRTTACLLYTSDAADE